MSAASILKDCLGCRAYPGSTTVNFGRCSCMDYQPSKIRCTHAKMQLGNLGSRLMRKRFGVLAASALRTLAVERVATSQALARARIGKCCAAGDLRCKSPQDSPENWGIRRFSDVAHRPGGSRAMSQERPAMMIRGMNESMRSAGCCASRIGLELSRHFVGNFKSNSCHSISRLKH